MRVDVSALYSSWRRVAKKACIRQLLRRRRLDEDEVTLALEQFGPVWESLTPREQARLVQLLVEKAEFDGKAGTLAITFRGTGIKTLADEILAPHQNDPKEKRA